MFAIWLGPLLATTAEDKTKVNKHFLLFYEVVEDYVNRRLPFRPQHLALAEQAANRGELVLGGALADPVDQAVLLFRGPNREVAEAFAIGDPYVQNGLVLKWTVREWTTLAGCALSVSAGTGAK